MSQTISPATSKPYGVQRVCLAWKQARPPGYARGSDAGTAHIMREHNLLSPYRGRPPASPTPTPHARRSSQPRRGLSPRAPDR